jgi:hypothetical protein
MGALIRISAIGEHRFDKNLDKNLTHEDWDFFLGLALGGAKIAKADQAALNYRIHGESRNVDYEKNFNSYYYIITKWAKLYHYDAEPYLAKSINKMSQEAASLQGQVKHLTDKIRQYDEQIDKLNGQIAKRDKTIHDIQNSRSYKLGLAITAPMKMIRAVKNLARKDKNV